jgi:hypothetical protein
MMAHAATYRARLMVAHLDVVVSSPARKNRVRRCTSTPSIRASILTSTMSASSPWNALHSECSKWISLICQQAGVGLFLASGMLRGKRYKHGGGTERFALI